MYIINQLKVQNHRNIFEATSTTVLHGQSLQMPKTRTMQPNVIQKLDGMNMIIQLKVQNHRNTFEATSTTVLDGLSFQMVRKMLRPGRTKKHRKLLCGNLIITNKKIVYFYWEMMSYRAINDIIQKLTLYIQNFIQCR